jgi:hypothetical protein
MERIFYIYISGKEEGKEQQQDGNWKTQDAACCAYEIWLMARRRALLRGGISRGFGDIRYHVSFMG